jgi:hypothetical protein
MPRGPKRGRRPADVIVTQHVELLSQDKDLGF